MLSHSGHLRLLEAVIDGLLAQGVEVRLAFSGRAKKPFKPARAREDQPRLIVEEAPVPKRTGLMGRFVSRFRIVSCYLRYLDPRYRAAPYLRERWGEELPAAMAWLRRCPHLPGPLLAALQGAAGAVERLIPTAPEVDAWIREAGADLLLVSPLVDAHSAQVDLVKSARKAGVPSALCVGSWDHLTTKSVIHVRPDRVFVWNEAQKREALSHHRLDPSEVEVTGAAAFDKWFGRAPSRSHEALCAGLGLPSGRPLLIYACSSSQICAPEAEAAFVERWLKALRRHPRLCDVGVVIRPHPLGALYWRAEDPLRFPGAVVRPRKGFDPADPEVKAEYFDTLHHAFALVGVNTSAMVEAAIVGRPPLTVLTPGFNQTSSLHFHHLAPENGGCLVVAETLDEHLEQLAVALEDPEAYAARLNHFVGHFIRPRGLDRPAAAVLAESALKLARASRRRLAAPPLLEPAIG